MTIGETLGRAVGSANRIRNEVMKPGQRHTRFVIGRYRVKLRTVQCKIQRRTVPVDGFVLGHPTYGKLGTAKLGGSYGSWSDVETINTEQFLTEDGRTEFTKWLGGESNAQPTHAGFGTSNTAYATDDSALGSETGSRVALTTNTATAGQIIHYGRIRSTDAIIGTTLKEVGIFSASASGVMFIRYVISDLATTNAYEYQVVLTTKVIDKTAGGSALITTAGLNAMRDWFDSANTVTAPSHMAWGTGTTAVAIGDTTLEGEQQRNAFTYSPRDSFVKITYEGFLDSDEANAQDLYKSGVFNAGAAGTLYWEQKFALISKTSAFTVYEYDILEVI